MTSESNLYLRAHVTFLPTQGRQPTLPKEKTMKKIVSGLLAATLSVSFAAAAAVPANAAQVFVPQASPASPDVQNVRDFRWRHGGHWRGGQRFSRNDGAYW